jgi:signal transduction histidine kinase
MPSLGGPSLNPGTALSVAIAVVVFAAAGSALWVASRQFGPQERRISDTLGAVLGATVLRRDRDETLALILGTSVKTLYAVSGTLYLGAEAGVLQLIAAEGVERFDSLGRLPVVDELVQALASAPDDVFLQPVIQNTPWVAMSPQREPLTLVAVRLGGRTLDLGLMVMAWRSHSEAELNLDALRAIGRYTRQVLGEFDVIAQRAREMQQVLAATQRQDVWVRTTAHDLGNKVQSATGTLMLLQATRDPGGPGRDLVDRLEGQLSLIQQMLSELTDPERPLEAQAVPVEELVEVVGGLMAMRRQAGVHYQMDVPTSLPDLWCDRLAVMRVFDNLLQNAVRHNGDQTDLHILVRADLLEDAIQFEVSDTGQGITAEAQSHLFEFGYRLDGTGRTKGYGLGLWSCRRIVEAHGGRMGVDSVPGQGAAFWFTLPVAGHDDVVRTRYASDDSGEDASWPAPAT